MDKLTRIGLVRNYRVKGLRTLTMNSGMYSSNSNEWETPQVFFDELNREFHFDIDVCATKANRKCQTFFSTEMNGLEQEWKGICWMNPPYGREIYKWIEKAYESSLNGATVVCLLPARTDTRWWHDYCLRATEIRFIKGRLKFGGCNNPAPFPSVVVIFRSL